jgi:predicted PurR-regulated permease PerM
LHARIQVIALGLSQMHVAATAAADGGLRAMDPNKPTQMSPGVERGLLRALLILSVVGIAAALMVGALQLLGATSTACVVILASIVVAYVLLPLLRRLQRYMPMPAALGLAYLAFFAGLALIVWTIVPPLISQAQQLATSLPGLIEHLQAEIADRNSPFMSRFPEGVRTWLQTLPEQIGLLVSKYGISIAQRTLGILTSAASVFLSLIIVPILTAYLFFDSSEIKRATMGFVPPSWRPKTLAILSDLNDVLGSFVRGQLLDGAILGTLIWLLLVIMHVPYALLIGVAAGILNFIPYVGAIIGFFPSVLLALVYNDWKNALIVAIGFGVIQQVDGNVIVPRIMKSQVQLSPVLLITSILLFSGLFGVVGTFLAVPVTAMARVLKLHFAPAPAPAEVASDEALGVSLKKF